MASPSETNKQNDEETEHQIFLYGVQLAHSSTLPLVLDATIQMGVLQIIHDHSSTSGLSPKEIVARMQPRPQNLQAPAMLDRMLRLLASYSVVSCTTVPTADGGVERQYRPAPVTKYFVPDEDGASLATCIHLSTDIAFLKACCNLKEAVLEGGNAFKLAHGMQIFEYSGKDPRFNEVVNKAMAIESIMIMKKILRKYKGFENIHQLVDVGGGLGYTLSAITSQYPFIKGINFDLPHVVATAPLYSGVEHVGGDMFESIPKGDAIFLKWIIHNWSDDQCLKLLKNCYKALPEGGKVIVVDEILTDEPETTSIGRAISEVDVTMLTFHEGGKERSKMEFEALAMGSGFSSTKLLCFVHNCWIMEFYK